MKSIKPGRGPSAVGAAGSLGAVLFGILWTVFAYNLTKDAPFPAVGIIFPLFGVVFILMGIVQTVYHYKNATGKQRMSLIDITDGNEEPDPLNRYFGEESRQSSDHTPTNNAPARRFEGDFCPFCGAKVARAFNYCPKCGEDI